MKCLIEGCDRPSKSRGLCAHCYQNLRNKVKSGEETWSHLASLGLAKEQLYDSRFDNVPTVAAYRKALAAEAAAAPQPEPPAAGPELPPAAPQETPIVFDGLQPAVWNGITE